MKTSHKYNKIQNIIMIQLFVTQAFQCKEWHSIEAGGGGGDNFLNWGSKVSVPYH